MRGESSVNVTIRETPYFYEREGGLYQELDITLSAIAEPLEITVTLSSEGRTATERYEAAPGDQVFRAICPCPHSQGLKKVAARINVGTETIESELTVGHVRPWTIYIA